MQERSVPELVAATGYGTTGGFTLFQVSHLKSLSAILSTSFQRDLPTLIKRKLHVIGGARGLWSLAIRQPFKASGISYEKPVNPYHGEDDSLILSTDINPSPGLSRVGFFLSQISFLVREC